MALITSGYAPLQCALNSDSTACSNAFIAPAVTPVVSTSATVQTDITTAKAVTLTATDADILPGQLVTGTGIDGPVTVVSIAGTALTLSSEQTIAASVVLTFITTVVTRSEDTVTAAVQTETTAANIVTLTAAEAGILPGQLVTGAGIDGSVTVNSIAGASLTLSSAQTIAAATSLTFSTIVADTTADVTASTSGTILTTATDRTITLNEANTNIQPGQVVTGTDVVGSVTVVSVDGGGTDFVLSSAQVFADGTVLTFNTVVVTHGARVTTATVQTDITTATAVTLGATDADILPGQLVTGTGIDGSVTVVSIAGTALTLSSEQTIAASVTLSFSTIVADTCTYVETAFSGTCTNEAYWKSDRVCRPVRACENNEYQTAAPDLTHDRVCASLPDCDAFAGLRRLSYELTAPATGTVQTLVDGTCTDTTINTGLRTCRCAKTCVYDATGGPDGTATGALETQAASYDEDAVCVCMSGHFPTYVDYATSACTFECTRCQVCDGVNNYQTRACDGTVGGESRPTAAIPMGTPGCSCKLTCVRFALQARETRCARRSPSVERRRTQRRHATHQPTQPRNSRLTQLQSLWLQRMRTFSPVTSSPAPAS